MLLIKAVDAMFVTITLLFVIFLRCPDAANILFIPAHNMASHAKSMYPLAGTLAGHGHHVTVLQILKLEQHKAESTGKVEDRYLIVSTDELEPFGIQRRNLWREPEFGDFLFRWKMTARVCRELMENAQLKEDFYGIIRGVQWDVVVVDDIFAPCGMLAAGEARRHWNASVIDFGTTILMPQTQEIRGSRINKILHPSSGKPPSGHFDHRVFRHRLYNADDLGGFYLVEETLNYRLCDWLGLPKSVYTTPSLFALNSDLLMVSLSPMLEFTKPMAKDTIELDVDCPRVTPLPEKYEKFVQDPKSKGTIIFALGHAATWDEAPDGVFESFYEAFANLSDYRIVWQYATTTRTRPRTPPHVKLEQWIPQVALLHHPKTKVFISHLGGKSFRETICAGVPAVAMPMFAEQYRNAAIAHKKKISVFLDKTEFSAEVILQAITEILANTKYRESIQKLKAQLDDQLMKSMELGRFWTEFLTRHKRETVRKFFQMQSPKLFHVQSASWDLVICCLVVVSVGLSVVF